MNALYSIFWYLKCEMSCGKNPNVGRLVYDSCEIEADDSIFTWSIQYQWKNFYPDAEELLLKNMPKPRGCSVKIRTYVGEDHAVNSEDWRSHTGRRCY